MQLNTVMLIDAENLVLRYQAMLKDGRKPHDDVLHIKDSLVWRSNLISLTGCLYDIIRVSCYTTATGDDLKLQELRETISNVEYTCKGNNGGPTKGTLVPYLYKKQSRGSTTKSVDINLTIDALRYAYGSSIEQIIIISGDGDYIPLYREIMGRGKMIQVWAFSNGLCKDVKYNVDDLHILDASFFKPSETSHAKICEPAI